MNKIPQSDTSQSDNSQLDKSQVGNTQVDNGQGDNGQDMTANDTEELSSRQTSRWSRALNIMFKQNPNEDLRDQLEQAVGLNAEPGDGFTEQERMMIANILRYGALRVEDVMVPRADIHAIDENASLEDLLLVFQDVGHSRIPVYDDTLDHPTGMVHVKDLLSWMADHRAMWFEQTEEQDNTLGLKVIAGGKNAKLEAPARRYDDPSKSKNCPGFSASDEGLSQKIKQSKLLREVLFVPPSMPVMNLLLRMQSTRVHLALVVDEYGGTDGLVSIEDLVEEVVGEIEDEHDEENSELISGRIDSGLTVSARIPIEDLEQELGIDLFAHEEERDDDIDTLGGLVFALVGHVPVRGEVITHPSGLEIEVLNADPRRVKTLKIIKK